MGTTACRSESGSCPKAFRVESSRKTRARRQEPHCSNSSLQRWNCTSPENNAYSAGPPTYDDAQVVVKTSRLVGR